jgi:uncharacterized protein YcbK (DUF882 family)
MITGLEHIKKCEKSIFRLIDQLELKFGTVNIISGYRTGLENIECGGAVNSKHLSGEAIDIQIKDVSIIKIANWALESFKEVKGFGLNFHTNVIHLDVRDSKTNVYWAYDILGRVV